ncbi:MAG: molybdopterin-dependent oxidoreductase, partial [Actinomycetota bacterium]
PRATINQACTPGGTVILVGPDPKEDLGALFLRLRHAVVNDGTTLIELTPARTGLSTIATHSLHPRPGEVGLLAAALVDATNGDAHDAAGVPAEAIAAAAASVSGPVTVVLGRASVAESSDATVDAALALNRLDGVGFLSALRRGNVHGALDMGMSPGLLPGRAPLSAGCDAFDQVPAAVGLDTVGMLEAAAGGDIDVLVLLGADPLTDVPDADLAERGLAGAGTVIAIEMLPNASTLAHADLVLPAAGPTEVSGTFTNLEGRVSIADQKVTPPGTARSDWMIAAEIALRLGADMGIESPESIRAEIAAVSPVHGALTEDALAAGRVEGVLITGSSIEAPTASGSTGPSNDAYSLRLAATRRMYDAGTMLQASPSSAGLAGSVKVALNPADFEKLGIEAGTVVKVVSGRGELMAPLAVDFGVPVGTAMVPANAPGSNANTLIDATALVTDVRVERA